MKLLVTLLLLCALGLMGSGALDSRIVGGEGAQYGDHPYICSLQMKYGNSWYHICGSVIWNKDYIVTAAHCVDSGSYRVQCGNHYMSWGDSQEVTKTVSYVVQHPGYSGSASGFPNDIAVLKLATSLFFNSKVEAYPLASNGSFLGESCILSGWGRLSGSGSSPNILHKVHMKKISNAECTSRWSSISGASINAGHICFYEPSKSACSGDSGGPVRCGNIITGITSWGISTCSGSYPSVYTRVSQFYDWLVDNAGPQP